MIDDILSLPEIATINGKEYKFEYTCKAYGIIETIARKSTFEIRDLMVDGKLGIIDSIEVICAGLDKNHTPDEILEIRKYIQDHLHVITEINMAVTQAFFKPLLPPEVFLKLKEAKKEITKILENGEKKTKRKKKAT